MLEYLMAGMWILLRDRSNRNNLARSFNRRYTNGDATETENKVSEAIEIHELAEIEQQRREAKNENHEMVLPDDPNAEDEWGMTALLNVGETWADGLKEGKGEQDVNASILKLFEFLTASLCLFAIPDDAIPEPESAQLYGFDSEKSKIILRHL